MIFARVSAHDAQETQALIQARCVAGGGHAVVIQGEDKASLLADFARQLDFPSYFGANLDALEESLGEWVAAQGAPVTLVVQAGAPLWRSAAGAAVREILGQLEDAQVAMIALETTPKVRD
ncbi:barstar family protein [Haematomicrobium sanguinis]|uniref:barstar family protein n=1 Tax=Haematomicrobium sanguinis TaxID=479106 RepID=UPI0005543B74|nr:barstar family protein [Haematomicrobium sanguinis]